MDSNLNIRKNEEKNQKYLQKLLHQLMSSRIIYGTYR